MSNILEIDVVRAAYGDCLIVRYGDKAAPNHILVDGGPSSCWDNSLEAHLDALFKKYKTDDDELVVELGICSHIDRDHIKGLLRLTDRLKRERETKRPSVRFEQFWHNNLRNTLKLDATDAHDAALASIGGDNVPTTVSDGISKAVLESYAEGNGLRANLSDLDIDVPFVSREDEPHELWDEMVVTVLAPSLEVIEKLRSAWQKKAPDTASLAATLDTKLPNLSSIVTLLEYEKKTILLTGDAVCTEVVAGLKRHGYKADGTEVFDVLKLPHHGSNRNVTQEFFRQVPARTYIISADGLYNNPDPDTLDMLHVGRAASGAAAEPFEIVLADDLVRGSKTVRDKVETKLAKEIANCKVRRPIQKRKARTISLL